MLSFRDVVAFGDFARIQARIGFSCFVNKGPACPCERLLTRDMVPEYDSTGTECGSEVQVLDQVL